MYNKFILIGISLVAVFFSCSKDAATPKDEIPVIQVSSPETGFIYLDGHYTGYQTPHEIKANKGKHVIGIAIYGTRIYLQKEVDIV